MNKNETKVTTTINFWVVIHNLHPGVLLKLAEELSELLQIDGLFLSKP